MKGLRGNEVKLGGFFWCDILVPLVQCCTLPTRNWPRLPDNYEWFWCVILHRWRNDVYCLNTPHLWCSIVKRLTQVTYLWQHQQFLVQNTRYVLKNMEAHTILIWREGEARWWVWYAARKLMLLLYLPVCANGHMVILDGQTRFSVHLIHKWRLYCRKW